LANPLISVRTSEPGSSLLFKADDLRATDQALVFELDGDVELTVDVERILSEGLILTTTPMAAGIARINAKSIFGGQIDLGAFRVTSAALALRIVTQTLVTSTANSAALVIDLSGATLSITDNILLEAQSIDTVGGLVLTQGNLNDVVSPQVTVTAQT